MTLRVLNPVARKVEEKGSSAPRLSKLEGKHIGLYWNFKAGGKSDLNNDKGLWQELQSFEWRGRTVYLAFDMDLWTNSAVRSALYELAFKLFDRGASVKIATWEGDNEA